MATAALPNKQDEPAQELFAPFSHWVMQVGVWYLVSMVFHTVALIAAGLMLGSAVTSKPKSDATEFETKIDTTIPDSDLTRFEPGEPPIEPTVLDTESLSMFQVEQTEQINDNSPVFQEAGGGIASADAMNLGGLGGFDVSALGGGPVVEGAGGVGTGVGTGHSGGSGGAGEGFGGRGSGMRKALVGTFGGTRQTERAVAAALSWFARHQNSDGSWSIDGYARHCKDRTCKGEGTVNSPTAATAMALLPFLAAGQTHQTKGPYQKAIHNGLFWLVKNQRGDGNLASRSAAAMYSHGLASIALCEAYGISKDKQIGAAAQRAIDYIESAQDREGGGWRYSPGQPGDTSVVGWQVMALKSGQMAGLNVSSSVLEGARAFLKSTAKGAKGGQFSYMPESNPSAAMSSVGLLCTQYLGASRNHPAISDGMVYLMRNLPKPERRNTYYWYYATQVMHNLPGPEWDAWNRQMRRTLIESQIKEGCAAGSWDPQSPTSDSHADAGGRIMTTSLSTLTLEVYYRYLPLYQIDKEDLDQPTSDMASTQGKKP
jgi:hypothetical protein